jgi:hypothetical protein
MVPCLHFLGRKRTVPKALKQLIAFLIASNQIFGLSVNIYRIQLFNVWATGSFVTLKICPFENWKRLCLLTFKTEMHKN